MRARSNAWLAAALSRAKLDPEDYDAFVNGRPERPPRAEEFKDEFEALTHG